MRLLNKNYIKIINSFAEKIYVYFIAFIFLGIINSALNLIEPTFAKILIDKSLNNNNSKEIAIIAITWAMIYLFENLCSYINNRLILKYKLCVYLNLRKELFSRLLRYPIEYFQKKSIGYILSRQTDDIEDLEGAFLYNILNFAVCFLEAIGLLFFMFKSNWLLAVICLIIIIANISLNFMFPIKQKYKKHNEQRALTLKELQDSISGIKIIKSMYAYEYESARFNKTLNKYYELRKSRDVMDIDRRNLSSFIRGFSNPLIIIIGVLLILRGFMTVGSVMSFTIYYSKLDGLMSPLINFNPLLKVAEAAMERVNENLSHEEEEDMLSSKNRILNGEIEFKNVQLNYDSKRKILDDVNFKIKSGSKVAFVGPSGSGKSSVISLLLRFYKYSKGKILIDGIDINKYSLKELRNSIGIVYQESFLFNRTLKENLIHNKKYTLDEINTALKDTFSDTIINNLDFGIDTIMSDRGDNLSGGEKQRLCITREILKKPKILILDEATSSLDTISEEIVQKAIDNIADDKTIIIIAHRLSTIKNADYIYVINKGEIVENGRHSELMKEKGMYYSLVNKQNSRNMEK